MDGNGELDEVEIDLSEDYESAVADLEDFKQKVEMSDDLGRLYGMLRDYEGKSEAAELERFRQEATRMINRLERLLRRIYQGRQASQQDAFPGTQVVFNTQALQAEVQWLRGFLSQLASGAGQGTAAQNPTVQQQAKASSNWLQQVLLPALNKAMTKIFRFIFSMLKPKEWSIKGIIGNTFLGFASGELEITFGPPVAK
jgi:hypothetical protein